MRFIIFGTGSIQLFLEEALASMLLLVVHSPILSTTTTTNSIGRVQWWPMMGNGLESSFVCPRDIRKLPIHFSTCTAKGASCKERPGQGKTRSGAADWFIDTKLEKSHEVKPPVSQIHENPSGCCLTQCWKLNDENWEVVLASAKGWGMFPMQACWCFRK